jgi:hypothetical protein
VQVWSIVDSLRELLHVHTDRQSSIQICCCNGCIGSDACDNKPGVILELWNSASFFICWQFRDCDGLQTSLHYMLAFVFVVGVVNDVKKILCKSVFSCG